MTSHTAYICQQIKTTHIEYGERYIQNKPPNKYMAANLMRANNKPQRGKGGHIWEVNFLKKLTLNGEVEIA